MPIAIHPKTRGRLIGLLRNGLAKTAVSRRGVHTVDGIVECHRQAEPLFESLNRRDKDTLYEALGHGPLLSYLIFKIASFAAINDRLKELEEQRPLGEVLSQQELEEFVEALVQSLEALPISYVASFPMSARVSEVLRQIGLPAVWQGLIAVADEGAAFDEFPPVAFKPKVEWAGPKRLQDLFRADAGQNVAVANPRVFIHFKVDGFIFSGEPCQTTRVAGGLLRSFLGLAIALGIFTEQFDWEIGSVSGAAHVKADGGWESSGTWDLQERDSRLMNALRIGDGMDSGQLAAKLTQVCRLFQRGEGGRRLRLAGKWLYDSFVGGEDVMRFMYLAIATEVLLGSDGGDVGLTKTLANRMAYMIAESSRERDNIKEEFNEIYQVRSKIVHNGLEQLSPSDSGKHRRLKVLTRRVVEAELRLALKDLDP